MNRHESDLQQRILLRATQLDCRLFRNTVAQGVAGQVERCTQPGTYRLEPGDYVVRHGRIIHAGLAVGSGDLIGWTPTIVNGERVAVFTSVEVKSPTGRASSEQHQWHAAVESAGGASVIARSLADYERLIRGVL